MKKLFGLILACAMSISFAATGQFFNLNATRTTLTVTSNIPSHYYSGAGIKIVTPGYTLADVGIACNLLGNSYCLFGVSHAQPKQFSFEGIGEKATFELCLNGSIPWSCERYNVNMTLYATGQNGFVASSTDHGETWTVQSSPDGSPVNALAFLEVTSFGDAPLQATDRPRVTVPNFQHFAATENGNILVSSNSGKTWTNRTPPDGSAVYDIQSPPIAFPQANILLVGTGDGNVARSENRAVSWTKTPTKPDGSAVNGVSFDCSCNDCFYAGTENGNVAFTANGGSTWTLLTPPEPGVAVYDVQTSDNCAALYVGLSDGQTKTSFDGGRSWQIQGVPNGSPVNGLLVHHSRTGYAATNSGQVLSTNSFGGSWSPLKSVPFPTNTSNTLKASIGSAVIDVISLPVDGVGART